MKKYTPTIIGEASGRRQLLLLVTTWWENELQCDTWHRNEEFPKKSKRRDAKNLGKP